MPLSRSRMTRAFMNDVYRLNALERTSSETSLLRSPTNRRNHAINMSYPIQVSHIQLLTWIPFKQSLVLPDLSRAFPQHRRPLPALGKFTTCTTALVYRSAGNIHTLLGKNSHVIFVGVGRHRCVVRGCLIVDWAFVRQVIWVHCVLTARGGWPSLGLSLLVRIHC